MGIRRLAFAAGIVALVNPGVGLFADAQEQRALPPNLHVPLEFRLFVNAMWDRSPTFRDQCARLAAAPLTQVRLELETRPSASGPRARAALTTSGDLLVSATIYVKSSRHIVELAGHEVELIAHELEHVIEQIDGVDLASQAHTGAAWSSDRESFETQRAIEAGRRVASEVTTNRPTGDAMPGHRHAAMTTVRLQDRFALPLSSPTARLSASGRYVVFVSSARLVAEDQNNKRDIYVLDLQTGETTLETAGADGDSGTADISGDGRFIVFESEAGNLTNTRFTADISRVFMRDRQTRVTTLLSASSHDRPANGPSGNPVISADATTVAFESFASDPPASAQSARGFVNVYVLRLATNRLMRIDVSAQSTFSPALSADGRFIVFASRGRAGCETTTVHWMNTVTGDTREVSGRQIGSCPDVPSYQPTISGDGRYVAFTSEASTLTTRTLRVGAQIYWHDIERGTTELISRSPRGLPANAPSARAALSFDGSRVAFQSLASNLVCERDCRESERDINLLWDVYVYDRTRQRTIRASSDADGEWMDNSRGPSLDASGGLVLFSSRHPVDRADVARDEDAFVRRLSEEETTTPPHRSAVRR